MKSWESLSRGERLEVGLIQADIAGHSMLYGSDQDLKHAKDILRSSLESITFSRGGKLFDWAGDGGSFMFLISAEQGFDSFCFAAIQMLAIMPIVNAEISAFTDLESSIRVRISCDTGTVTYDPDPTRISGDFLNKFLKNERAISIENGITITERIYRQLRKRIRDQFTQYKHAPELGCDLYQYVGPLGDWKQEFQAVKVEQRRQAQEIEAIKFLLAHFLTGDECRHLEGLASDKPYPARRDGTTIYFEMEMRRLRALGFIEGRPGCGVRSLLKALADAGGKEVNVKEHFVITPRGRDYLSLRSEMLAEPAGSGTNKLASP
jgi:hypothetical protein